MRLLEVFEQFFLVLLGIALFSCSHLKNELSLNEDPLLNWSQDLVLPSTLSNWFTKFLSNFEKSLNWKESFLTFFCWYHCWLWAGYSTCISSVNLCPPKVGLLKIKVFPVFITHFAPISLNSNLSRQYMINE